jgi:hypothetical protein
MSAYIKQLNAAVAVKAQARREDQERAAAQAARERLTPFEERLSRLLARIPPAVQAEGLSLSSLQSSLRGRTGAAFQEPRSKLSIKRWRIRLSVPTFMSAVHPLLSKRPKPPASQSASHMTAFSASSFRPLEPIGALRSRQGRSPSSTS